MPDLALPEPQFPLSPDAKVALAAIERLREPRWHLADYFDAIRDHVKACNMCCIRFNATEAVQAAGIPIVGEGKDHIDIGRYVLEGYQVINH